MNVIVLGCLSILVLAVLVLIGGIIGFKKAKSKASLIAGTVSALLLAGCYVISTKHPESGFILAFMLAGILEGIFIVRLVKTKKFMPSGMMLVLCVIEQIILLVALPRG